MAREINLVPDIKNEMIKALKLRNLIFFLCIVIAAASVGVIVIFGLIAGGQQLARDSKKSTIDQLSEKLKSYSDLNDTLTIKDQLGNISTLTSNKKVLSRTFGALSALLPVGADTITISELKIDFSEEVSQPTLSMEAQADAGREPFIDYNVLDSFKKSMAYMRYDYGNYVDKEGNTIPAYCMIEQGTDGATFKEDRDGKSNYYAYWTIEGEGCNPSENLKTSDYTTEQYEDQTVVRIWRTPQFSDWYKANPKDKEPQMSLDGTISNVEHFESSCIRYQGDDSNDSTSPKWSDSNDCRLIYDSANGTEGITILESSNGRDVSDNLVLRFNAVIYVAPEFYDFNNSHMLAIAPSGRLNVTDSYVQVQAMFGQRASDCKEGDADCSAANSNASSNREANNSVPNNNNNVPGNNETNDPTKGGN